MIRVMLVVNLNQTDSYPIIFLKQDDNMLTTWGAQDDLAGYFCWNKSEANFLNEYQTADQSTNLISAVDTSSNFPGSF